MFGRNDPHLKIGKIKYRSIFLIALEQPSHMAWELLTPGRLAGPEDRLVSGAAGPSRTAWYQELCGSSTEASSGQTLY